MGLAALRITSGATSMSGKSSLAYLKVTEARELRELLLNRRKIAVLPDAGTQVLNARSFNTEVVSYPIYDVSQLQNETSSYWFQMSSGQLIATIITPFIIPSLLIALIEIIITLIAQSKNAVGISVGITIPIIVSLGSELWRRFSRLSGYKIDIMNDSLRITSGLLTVNHETIPFNRVQALRIEQPMLWKLLRLYRLQINLAGTSNKTRVNRQNLTIIPACSFYTAVSLIKNIQPEFDLSVPMISPPKIAFIKGLFWANVHRLGLTKETAVLSYGIVKKRWDLIYFGKIQSLRIKTGPVNKLLKLNNLYIDSTKGPIQFRIKWRSDNDTSEVSKFIADSVAVWFANNH
jgi:putative membrane protein